MCGGVRGVYSTLVKMSGVGYTKADASPARSCAYPCHHSRAGPPVRPTAFVSPVPRHACQTSPSAALPFSPRRRIPQASASGAGAGVAGLSIADTGPAAQVFVPTRAGQPQGPDRPCPLQHMGAWGAPYAHMLLLLPLPHFGYAPRLERIRSACVPVLGHAV